MAVSNPSTVNKYDLQNYALKTHDHDVTNLLNFDAGTRALILRVLAEQGLTTGPGAPPPPPAPSPSPSPGVGTGVTETSVPRRVQPGGIGHPATGVYIVNIGIWATSDEAYDKITLTARINGAPAGAVSWTSDADPADILAACTYGTSSSQIGGILSFMVEATNEAGTTTAYIDGVYVDGASTTPGFGTGSAGSTSPPASGSLTFGSLSVGYDFTISSVAGVRSWAIIPTLAGIVKKAGGESLTIATLGTTGVEDDTGTDRGAGVTITWAGGTPTTSGTSDYAVVTPWNTTGEGLRITALADTTERTCVVNLSAYSSMAALAISLSDNSATPLLINVPAASTLSGTTPEDSVNASRAVAFKFKAGSAGQSAQIDITTPSFAGAGGNCHIQSVHIF